MYVIEYYYFLTYRWLDKLGISASLGIDTVVRQDFYGGNYGLIDTKTLDPNPVSMLNIDVCELYIILFYQFVRILING